MSSNPYAAPGAVVGEVVSHEDQERLQRVASGQRMMVWAVLGTFLTNGSMRAVEDSMLGTGVLFLLWLACLIFAIIGAVRLLRGLGARVVTCVFVAIFMIIPLFNLIAMLILSNRATRALRAAGFKVGLMGARGI